MLNIALADDELIERNLLRKYFNKFSIEVHEEVVITAFSSGDELMKDYNYSYDLICLDIDMVGNDGVEIAKEIRKLDEQVLIIFITNMAQMAIRGYEVQALDFVVKPVNYYTFAMKMRNAFNIINSRKNKNIVLSTADGFHRITTNDLLYAEVNGHYLYYHTTDGIVKQKAALRELEEKLEGLSFKRCNNCYLVNLKHVSCVKKDEIKVAEEWLKISRPRKKDFLQALTNYIGGVGG